MPAERSVIADLTTTVDELREQLVAALKKACEYMDKAMEAAAQVEKATDIVTKMSDHLKEQVNCNIPKLLSRILFQKWEPTKTFVVYCLLIASSYLCCCSCWLCECLL